MKQQDAGVGRVDTYDSLPLPLRRHAASVYRYLLVLSGDREMAEELLQRVFLRVFQSARRDEILARDAGYFLIMARHEFFQELRRAKVREPAVALETLLYKAAPQETPAAASAARETAARLQRELFRLPVEQREVIQLRLFEGLSLEEIARISGIARTTLSTRYQAALATLKERLHDFAE